MAGVLDDRTISIPCKDCGRKTDKVIGWLKTHRQFTCKCGTIVRFDADKLRRKLADVERNITELKRMFKSLNKR